MLPDTYLGVFLPHVIPHCPSCPDPVALHMLRRAAQRFCERTKAWRYTATQAISANGPVVVTPTPSQIVEIESATFDGADLSPSTFVYADPEQLTGQVSTGRPLRITQVGPGSVQIEPFTAGTLRVSLFLKPRPGRSLSGDPSDPLRDTLDMVPAFLFDQHADAIAAGALALILAIPDQAFTNLQMAGAYGATFEAACVELEAVSRRGQQRAPRRVPARWL